jgi:nicotinamidase-related amidase
MKMTIGTKHLKGVVFVIFSVLLMGIPLTVHSQTEWQMAGKPALIIIHMQYGIVNEGGTVAFLGHAKATKESGIIPRQQALLKAFRDKKLPVIYVNAVTDPNSVIPAYGRFWGAFKKVKANMPNTKDVEVIPELAPQPGEPVMANWPFGTFTGNNLDKVLKEMKVETVVLVGVATDMAVLSGVIQASDLLLNVIVPSDASTSASKPAHEAAMNLMIPAMALVTTTDDVLAHLSK